jgi:hypothetical protein
MGLQATDRSDSLEAPSYYGGIQFVYWAFGQAGWVDRNESPEDGRAHVYRASVVTEVVVINFFENFLCVRGKLAKQVVMA